MRKTIYLIALASFSGIYSAQLALVPAEGVHAAPIEYGRMKTLTAEDAQHTQHHVAHKKSEQSHVRRSEGGTERKVPPGHIKRPRSGVAGGIREGNYLEARDDDEEDEEDEDEDEEDESDEEN